MFGSSQHSKHKIFLQSQNSWSLGNILIICALQCLCALLCCQRGQRYYRESADGHLPSIGKGEEFTQPYKRLRQLQYFLLCKPRPLWISCQNFLCKAMASRMLSVSYDQLNMTMLPVIYDHLSHRSSSKVVYHFSQVSDIYNIEYFGDQNEI